MDLAGRTPPASGVVQFAVNAIDKYIVSNYEAENLSDGPDCPSTVFQCISERLYLVSISVTSCRE
jgi:hypothetical protein